MDYEKAFNEFSIKWLERVFKGDWDEDKFGRQPECYNDTLTYGARFVLLFTRFLMQVYEEMKEQGDKKPLFVFVTKKGYWLYRCVRELLCLLPDEERDACTAFWDSIWVKSDRYFTKAPCVDEFADCQIFIIDDIVHTGANFSRMRDLIENSRLKITKFVAFAVEERRENLIDGIEKKEIRYCSDLSSTDLGNVSIEEIMLFHSLGVPYAIDLPSLKVTGILALAQDDGLAFSSGRLTREEFDLLCSWCAQNGWNKVGASHTLNNQQFENCFFWNPRGAIERKFKNLLQSLIIECSYRDVDMGDGQTAVDVTFIPFAIMRSVKWQELVRLFSAAFKPSPYYDEIASYLLADAEPSEALATALYRSVVFYLSGYAAVCFNEILQDIGLSLAFRMDHMKEHWDDKFLESIRSIFCSEADCEDKQNWPITGCTSIYAFYRGNDITPDPKYWVGSDAIGPQAGKLDVNLEMYKFFVKDPDPLKKSDRSFEDLEIGTAGRMGCSVNDPRFREAFLQGLLRLLNQSSISNTVHYDRTSNVVVRGFRAGENCALLLPFDQPVVFCAISIYYQRWERSCSSSEEAEQQYRRNFDYFQKRLLEYISDAGYGFWIDQMEATHLLDYFKNLSNVGRQIKNREYLMDGAQRGGSADSVPIPIVKNIIEFSENLELPWSN